MKNKRWLLIILLFTWIGSLGYPVHYQADSNVKDWLEEKEVDKQSPPTIEKEKRIDEVSTDLAKRPSIVGSVIKIVVLLALILFLIYYVLKFVNKRSQLYSSSHVLKNLGGITLGQNKSIQMICIGEEMYIVGVGDNVELLREVTDETTKKAILTHEEKKSMSHQGNLSLNIFKKRKQDNTAVDKKNYQPFSYLFQKEMDQMRKTRKTLIHSHHQRKESDE